MNSNNSPLYIPKHSPVLNNLIKIPTVGTLKMQKSNLDIKSIGG